MTDTDQKKQDDSANLKTVATAVAGAVVGAGIAVAGVAALKDEATREKVKKVIKEVKTQATDFLQNAQELTHEKRVELEENIADAKDEIVKAAKAAEDSLSKD